MKKSCMKQSNTLCKSLVVGRPGVQCGDFAVPLVCISLNSPFLLLMPLLALLASSLVYCTVLYCTV